MASCCCVVCSKHQLLTFPQHRSRSSHGDYACLNWELIWPSLHNSMPHKGNMTDAFSDLGQKWKDLTMFRILIFSRCFFKALLKTNGFGCKKRSKCPFFLYTFSEPAPAIRQSHPNYNSPVGIHIIVESAALQPFFFVLEIMLLNFPHFGKPWT